MRRNKSSYTVGNSLPLTLPSHEAPSTPVRESVYFNPQVSDRPVFPFLFSHVDFFQESGPGILRNVTLRDLFVDWGDLYWLSSKNEDRIQWFCWFADKFILNQIGDIPLSLLDDESLQKLITSFEKEARLLKTDPHYIQNVLYSFLSFSVRLGVTFNPVIIHFVDRYRDPNP